MHRRYQVHAIVPQWARRQDCCCAAADINLLRACFCDRCACRHPQQARRATAAAGLPAVGFGKALLAKSSAGVQKNKLQAPTNTETQKDNTLEHKSREKPAP